MPNTVSQAVPQPLVKGFEFGVNTCQPVVVHPSFPHFYKLLKPFFETVRFGFLGKVFELSL